ncbi:Putative aliphatic sulfonates-binding protein [Ralstonia edaphis]|uniref:aliphatic sulfonate ABC transporter substrate-binding protein n=1 Tax=Ralstonia edaphi TaxID=3058599 RepID=UPI0028F600A4|nr:aliphatic sulfonate ABC transporter substrate-binding protein [Ralstonia sp. LMG 6871]CAJ0686527.1 Putative aliphatic sulfonates-binding protein [Ralstonia sp. LMG 6871]
MTIDIQRRRLLSATVAGASLATLGPVAHAANAATAASAAAGLPKVTPPAQLRIGFQKSAVNLVIVKENRALEQRFPGTKIGWLEFPAGPQQLEALSAGSLDLAITGDTPPVFAQAAGKDLRYVGVEPPKPDSSAILVQQDSTLKTLADLKGKRVALQKGSSAHFLIVRGLQKGGLSFADIQPVYLTPADARAAFERGSVDAWGIWDPYYAATELAIKPRVLATGRTLSSNNSFYFAPTAFTEKHGDTIAAIFAELSRADRLVQENRKEAAQRIADFSGLSLATVHLFLSRRPPSPVRPVTPEAVAEQQRVADAFHGLGLIPRPVKPIELVWHPTPAQLAIARA